MNRPSNVRVILRALRPAAALVFFVAFAVRNPDRMALSLFCAALAGAVLFSRLKPRKPR
jgi:hypothetical protein